MVSTDIPQMTSEFVEIVPPYRRQGGRIPFAASRWHDFGNRPALGKPFDHFSRHPDAPRLLLSPRRLAYAGAGLGRRTSIRARTFWNKPLGSATSANRNVTYRPCLTTFAPILIRRTRSDVSHQRSVRARGVNLCLWLRLFGPCPRHDRPTSRSRPTIGDDRFAPDFVCFTSRCGPS